MNLLLGSSFTLCVYMRAGLCILRVPGHWAHRLCHPEPQWEADRQQIPNRQARTAARACSFLS